MSARDSRIRRTTPQDHTGCRAGNRPEAATGAFAGRVVGMEARDDGAVLDDVDSHGSGEMLSNFCYIFKVEARGLHLGYEKKNQV